MKDDKEKDKTEITNIGSPKGTADVKITIRSHRE